MKDKLSMTQSGIAESVALGNNVKIVCPVNLYDCKIGHNCFVGPFVEVQSNATIGDLTKIQSHSFVCSKVVIGKSCFIGHGVMFINDLFETGGPAKGDQSKWRETVVGDNVSIGSNSTILPVTICDNAVIGAGSVVTKDILTKGVYAGNPAKYIRAL